MALVALAFLCLTMNVMADATYQDFGITNRVMANGTTSVNLGSGLKIDNQDNASAMFLFQGDAAGTGAMTITWARSHDGTNYETTPRFVTATALNGNTAVIFFTNLIPITHIGASIFIKPVSIANADVTANATNCSLLLLKKNPKRAP